MVQKQFLHNRTDISGRVPIENYEFPEDPCPLHTLPTSDAVTALPALSGEKHILYVNSGNCQKLDNRVKVLSEIKRSDGTVVFTLQIVAE